MTWNIDGAQGEIEDTLEEVGVGVEGVVMGERTCHINSEMDFQRLSSSVFAKSLSTPIECKHFYPSKECG